MTKLQKSKSFRLWGDPRTMTTPQVVERYHAPYGTTTNEPLTYYEWFIDTGLGDVLSALKELLSEDEEDDYGVLRPTPYAFKTMLELILQTSPQIRGSFPYGAVCTDSEGGLRIEWQVDGRELALVIPAQKDGLGYIFFQEGEKHAAKRDVTAFGLAAYLDWLTNS